MRRLELKLRKYIHRSTSNMTSQTINRKLLMHLLPKLSYLYHLAHKTKKMQRKTNRNKDNKNQHLFPNSSNLLEARTSRLSSSNQQKPHKNNPKKNDLNQHQSLPPQPLLQQLLTHHPKLKQYHLLAQLSKQHNRSKRQKCRNKGRNSKTYCLRIIKS